MPEKAGLNGEILREIAKDILKEPDRVNIQVNFSMSLKINQLNGKNQLFIYYSHPFITGDIWYRRFLISDVLLPSVVNLKVFWAKKNNPGHVSVTSFREKVRNEPENLVISGSLPAFDPGSDTIYAGVIVPDYDSLDLLKFKSRISLINDYYSSFIILDSVNALHQLIHAEDNVNIPLSFVQIEESDKILEIIGERKFQDNLLMQSGDHLNLMKKYQDSFRRGRSIHFTFIDLLSATGAIIWDGDIAEFADYFTARMLSYVRRAQLIGDLQGKICQDYLDQWFSKNAFGDDLQITETILAKMYPDAKRDTLVAFMAKEVYQSYLRLSSRLIVQGQYSEAENLLEHASKLRDKAPFLIHSAEAEKIQHEAIYGVYSSFLGIASGCIASGKPEMAVNYLEKADEYKKKHTGIRMDDALYRQVSLELLMFRLNSPDRLMQDMKIRELLYCPE